MKYWLAGTNPIIIFSLPICLNSFDNLSARYYGPPTKFC